MKYVFAISLVFCVVCGIANAQVASGVYVEKYVEGSGWRNVSGFPDRYHTDFNGDPDPAPGLTGGLGLDINLSTVAGVFYCIYAVSPSSTDIGDIDIAGDGIVFIGRHGINPPALNRNIELDFQGCRDLGRVHTNGGKAIVKARLRGDLLGDFFAYDIASLKCDSIRGEVIHNPSNDPSAPKSGTIKCNSIATSGSITSVGVELRVVEVVSFVAGTIQTTNGAVIHNLKIGSLAGGTIISDNDLNLFTVLGNAYGTIDVAASLKVADVRGSWGSNGVVPRPLDLSVMYNIDVFEVEGDFIGDLPIANIDHFLVDGNIYNYDSVLDELTPSNVTTFSDIRRFAAVGFPASPLGNDESRLNLTAPTVGAFYIGAPFEEGLVNLTNGIAETFVNKQGVVEEVAFRLGFGMSDQAHFHFGYDPLNSAVRQGIATRLAFLNNNSAFAPVLGAWEGEVSVGLTPTDSGRIVIGENTSVVSAEIGGGTFGNAPFNFHQRTTAAPAGTEECVPYQNELSSIGAFDTLNEVTISHYGPVYVDGPGPHFRVEFKPAWGTGVPGSDPLIASWSWEDKTSLFQVVVIDQNGHRQSGDSDATSQRKVVIKNDASKGNTGFKVATGQWRIRPITDKVKCGGVFGNPNVEYDSNYVDRDLGAATGLQYSWYHFNTGLASISGSMLITGDSPSANDLSEWLIHPYEVNADGEIDYQDFVDIAEGYVAD